MDGNFSAHFWQTPLFRLVLGTAAAAAGYEYERLKSEYFDQKSWKTDRSIRRNRFDLALTFSKWLHTVSAGQRKRNRNSRSEAFTEPSWLWENAIS